MFNYEDLEWFIMFPFLCGVMMWFSIDLALLVRIGGGRRRRKNARDAIESMVLHAPAVANRTMSPKKHRRHTPDTPQRPRHEEATDINTAPLDESAANLDRHYHGENGVHPHRKRYRKVVDIPTSMRIATKVVTRRAVVVVGGDFARSPRMQYHAASLAQSGLFDEVVLVGLDCGNELSEALRQSGLADPETFYLDKPQDEAEVKQVVWERFRRPHDRRKHTRTGCLISVRYLTTPPTPPEWFQLAFPVRRLHWIACTLYRGIAFLLVFSWLLARATAIRVNAHGQLLLTDLILVQTPPAVPFVLLVKYLVRPLCFLYSGLVYYGFIVPASWFNKSAVKELRELSCAQTHPIFTAVREEANGTSLLAASPTVGASSSTPLSSSHDGSSSDNNGSNHPLHSKLISSRTDEGTLRRRAGSSTFENTNSGRARAKLHDSRAGSQDRDGVSVIIAQAEHQQQQQRFRHQIRTWWRAGLVRWSVFWPSLVVDWHNFGYTILKTANRPTLVTNTYKFLELHFCAGDINLTVSHAMKRFLLENHIVPRELAVLHEERRSQRRRDAEPPVQNRTGTVVEVLYDVAPSFFGPASRRKFVEEVVLPMNRITAARSVLQSAGSQADAAPKKPRGFYNRDEDEHSSSTGTSEVARREATLQEGGWGLNSPPAWVMEEVFGSSPSPSGNGTSHLPPPAPHTSSSQLQQQQQQPPPQPSPTAPSKKRGIMIVGATSWTEDDDYTILVEALQRLDHRLKHEYKYLGNSHTSSPSRPGSPANNVATGGATNLNFSNAMGIVNLAPGSSIPPRSGGYSASVPDSPTNTAAVERRSASLPLDVWVLITGKGVARARFENAIRAANLSSHVVVSTGYLQSYQQYSTTIGSADVGLCLHFSSSGLDLPMKGVDMVGSGIPVMAYAYPAVEELMGPPLGSPASTQSSISVGSGSHKNGSFAHYTNGTSGTGLVECERGWVFSNAAALEKLLGSLIGLDALCDRMNSMHSGGSGNAVSSLVTAVPGVNGFATPRGRSSLNNSPFPVAAGSLGSSPLVATTPNGEGVTVGALPPLNTTTTAMVLDHGSGGNTMPRAEGSLNIPAVALLAPASPYAKLIAAQHRARTAPRATWEENWNATLKPILDEIV